MLAPIPGPLTGHLLRLLHDGEGPSRCMRAAPPPHLAVTGRRAALRHHFAEDGMRARICFEAAEKRINIALHAPSRWRQSLQKCLVQTQGVRTWTGKPRQNTLREIDDARTNTAEKNTKIRS